MQKLSSHLTIKEISIEIPHIVVGVLEAEGLHGNGRMETNGGRDSKLHEQIRSAVAQVRQLEGDVPSWIVEIKGRVRDMLRHGSFRPTGRSKPASEYLWNAAMEERFPELNNLVDAANLVSLETLLPISLVDVSKLSANRLVVRFGRAGEEYVFNPAGQVFELEDKLVVCELAGSDGGDRPFAGPIKDSQATKTDEDTNRVLGLVYAPESLAAEAEKAVFRLATILNDLGASEVWGGVVSQSSSQL